MPKIQRGDKAAIARRYLRIHPEATRKQFMDTTGVEVSNGYFSTLRSEIREKIKARAEKRKDLEAGDTIGGHIDGVEIEVKLRNTETKLDEYRYRCWKLEGEKFGYVQRLKGESS